jgi:dipeptidyl aminopeptidase/acylaminoacyl peptidase
MAVLIGLTLYSFVADCPRARSALSPAEALNYERIGDLHFSPDGRKLAYIALSYPKDWLPRVCVVDIRSGALREITPANKSERSPEWSSDGKTLAFLSNRGGKVQVYAMSAAGEGEAVALTDQKAGVSGFHWSPDEQAIAYLAKVADPDPEAPKVADSERELARLWVFNLATKTGRQIGPAGYRIDDFRWQDASHILVAASAKPRVEEFNDAIYSIALKDGTIRTVAQPPQPFDSVMVSPDGAHFAVRSTRANGPIPRDLLLGAAGGAKLHDISASIDLAVLSAQWHESATIWTLMDDGFYRRLYRLPLSGPARRVDLPLSIAAFDIAQDGSIAFAGEDFAHLPEIYLRNPDGHIRQLTHIQQGITNARLQPTNIFKMKSFDGSEIESALVKPAVPPSKGKMPLVLLVHGGPSSNFTAGYTWETAWAQMLATHGYEVLMVNPRGSNGYSEDFLKANRGDWGGGDYKDLLTVLDAVLAKGETDPNRLGIGGWSYGGEMSAWAITQSNRFKAAVFGAGVFDQTAEFETEDGPAGDEWYFGTPWEHPEIFARNSPSTFIRSARTPTLILDGEEDKNNPVGQSTGLYRALKHFGVETQLVLYPGEGHSPRKGSYNVDMFQRILDWYDRHLGKHS